MERKLEKDVSGSGKLDPSRISARCLGPPNVQPFVPTFKPVKSFVVAMQKRQGRAFVRLNNLPHLPSEDALKVHPELRDDECFFKNVGVIEIVDFIENGLFRVEDMRVGKCAFDEDGRRNIMEKPVFVKMKALSPEAIEVLSINE